MSQHCCGPGKYEGTNAFFSRMSKTYERRFRRKGLEKVQRYLLEGVRMEPVGSKEILDIGCGVGALHLTLLAEGAVSATGVDLSEGMLQQARASAERLGYAGKTRYVFGDFVDEAGTLPDADITLMDKVVCCYENADALVDRAAAKSRRVVAISHPKESFPIRFSFRVQIFLAALFRFRFHPFWHDWQKLCDRLRSAGFEQIYENSTIVWSVVVFRRAS